VGERPRDRVVAFFTRNPPLYAAIAALLAPDSLAPNLLVDISRGAVIALLPIGFFAVGAVLAEEATEEQVRLGSPLRPPVAAAILLRLGLAPGLLYLLALPFIDLPGSYLLLAAMPCGINTLLVSHVYGLDVRLAAQAVAWSTAIALVGVAVSQVT
jgi:predicted permease